MCILITSQFIQRKKKFDIASIRNVVKRKQVLELQERNIYCTKETAKFPRLFPFPFIYLWIIPHRYHIRSPRSNWSTCPLSWWIFFFFSSIIVMLADRGYKGLPRRKIRPVQMILLGLEQTEVAGIQIWGAGCTLQLFDLVLMRKLRHNGDVARHRRARGWKYSALRELRLAMLGMRRLRWISS